MQNPQLVHIKTSDGLILPGLLYEAPKSKKTMIFLHGNGSTSVFYQDDLRPELAEMLHKKGISFLIFNNRGAEYIRKLEVEGQEHSKRYGMAYEKIKDCIQDIDGAITFLEKRGYTEFYLIGESTGANKICVYDYYKPNNKIAKYVLISGGDDTGIYYDQLGEKTFYRLLNKAKEMIKKGKGEELITELLPHDILSYNAFYDTCNPDGDYNVFPFLEVIRGIKLSKKPLFRHVKSINKPTLVIYGEKDEYALGGGEKSIKILKQQKPEFSYVLIKGADHSISKQRKQYAQAVVNWL